MKRRVEKKRRARRERWKRIQINRCRDAHNRWDTVTSWSWLIGYYHSPRSA